MAVPTDINDLSATASSNSPAGTDAIGTSLDDYLRGIQAVLRGELANKGADIASASTTDVGSVVGLYHDITGTTAITSLGSTGTAGQWKILQFDGALTFTHNATSLILPGAQSITTAAGDHCVAVCLGSGDWVVPIYVPKSGAMSASFRKNAIINGGMDVWQRGTSFTAATTPANNDDTYLMDRWVLLSDGNDVVDVTREASTIPTNGLYAASLDVETINKKFGLLQIIEQKNCKGLIGKTCTLSFKARVSETTKLDNLKAAIIAWNSTADTVTSDIVSAWGVEDTNPTLATNWTYENTPANLSPTTSYQTFSVTAAIDTASTTNIGVFIWSDVTDTTAGHFLYITDVQLEPGSVATEFEYRTFQEELLLCQRYYEKSFAYGTAPAQNVGANTGEAIMSQTVGASGSLSGFELSFKVRKIAAPTVTLYNPAAANAQARNYTTANDCSSTSCTTQTERNANVDTTAAGSSAAGNRLGLHWQAVSEL